jgi:MFS family permease
LIQALRELRGNPRPAVFTEALFGVPFNMYSPFLSVYMLALGVTDEGLGLIASIGMVVQMAAMLVSGALVDRFGRRRTLLIADLLSWSLSCLIWALSRNMTYLLIGTMMHSLWRIALTAWNCLVLEDAQEHQLVAIMSWTTIFGLCTSFLTPVGGLFVARYGLVPAMRGLLAFGFVVLALKALLQYRYSRETGRGMQRMAETRNQSLWSQLSGYRQVARELVRSRPILAALSLMLVTTIYGTVNSTFWGVHLTTRLGFPESHIAIFPAVQAAATMACFFLLSARLRDLQRFRLPLWLGFGLFLASQGLLVLMPPRSVPLVALSVVLAAVAAALVHPMIEALLSRALESHERARLSALVYAVPLALTTPFGWIAGRLSAIDRVLPFVLNIILFLFGGALVWLAGRWQPASASVQTVARE